VGYAAGSPSALDWIKPEPVAVRIVLSDQTWLRFVIAGEEIGGPSTPRLLLVTGLRLIGIAALGLCPPAR